MKLYSAWGERTYDLKEAHVIEIDRPEDYQELSELDSEGIIRIHGSLWGTEKVLFHNDRDHEYEDKTDLLRVMAVVTRSLGVVA